MLREAYTLLLLLKKENRDLSHYYFFCRRSRNQDGLKAIQFALTDKQHFLALTDYRHFATIWSAADDLLFDGGAYANEETAERHAMAFQTLKEIDAWVLGRGPNPFNR